MRTDPTLTSITILPESRPHLVKVEHQVELTHVVEVLIQHLHKVMNGLQISQVVVGYIHTYAEV